MNSYTWPIARAIGIALAIYRLGKSETRYDLFNEARLIADWIVDNKRPTEED